MTKLPLLLVPLLALLSCDGESYRALASGSIDEVTQTIKSTLLVDQTDLSALENDGFTPLIGADLRDWLIHNDKPEVTYILSEGVISGVAEGLRGNSFLYTKESYQDYLLYFEFRFDHLRGNSGLLYHAGKQGDKFAGLQFEMDPGDKKRDGVTRQWTGLLYAENLGGWHYPNQDGKIPGLEKATTEQMKEFSIVGGEALDEQGWNAGFIRIRGNKLETWLNGTLRTNYTYEHENYPAEGGSIGLQIHGGKECAVSWRNIYLKPLEK